ncbi:MAG: RNA polymerase sigma factor [Actinomycetes bacterium]
MPVQKLSTKSPDMSFLETDHLSRRLAAGDELALEEGYRLYGSMVRRYLQRFVNSDETDDLLQVVFLELWRSRGRIDPNRPLEAWLFGIARKRAIDHLRRRRHDVVSVDLVRELVGDDGAEFADRLAWSAEIQTALATLVPEQRDAITLAYFGGLSQREIAEHLRVPLGTVKARMARGMRVLSSVILGGVEK